MQDLILTGVVVALTEPPPDEEPPPADEGEEPQEPKQRQLEITLAPPDGGEVVCSAPLTRVGPSSTEEGAPVLFEARRLGAVSCDKLPGLCVSVRVVACATPLFEAPLEEPPSEDDGSTTGLMIGSGLCGKVPVPGTELPAWAGEQPEGACAPTGTATLACAWRKQQALPAPRSGTDRMSATSGVSANTACQSLSMRYGAPDDRQKFEDRLMTWRTEMGDVTKEPKYPLFVEQYDPLPWQQQWLPPYIPHHMYGDPQTQATRNEYIEGGKELTVLFRSQAVAVELSKLMEVLPTCAKPEQAFHALEAVHNFLNDHKEEDQTTTHVSPNGVRTRVTKTVRYENLPQIDAAATLKLVRRLNLPFERLVRNVWMEGPEVYYDRSKASLEKLLQKEVARRKALKVSPPVAPTDTFTSRHGVVMSGTRIHEGKHAPRKGLLNFPGKPLEEKKAVRAFGE